MQVNRWGMNERSLWAQVLAFQQVTGCWHSVFCARLSSSSHLGNPSWALSSHSDFESHLTVNNRVVCSLNPIPSPKLFKNIEDQVFNRKNHS